MNMCPSIEYPPAHNQPTAEIAARIRNALQVIKLRQACDITYPCAMTYEEARASLGAMSLDGAELVA